MNTTDYISSGILESYVLGTVSEQERKEVECLSHIYPEIKEELIRLQNVMEMYALQNTKAPNPAVKNKILQKIKTLPVEEEKTLKQIQIDETKIIPISKKNNLPLYITLAVAASFALLFLFTFQAKNEMEKQLADVKSQLEKMGDDYLTLDATMIALNDLNTHMGKELEMFRNPDFKTVFLTKNHPMAEGSKAIICWNKIDKTILIAADHLPEKGGDKDFQLWAIVNGKPVDMGVLPAEINGNFMVLPSTVENPQAFAITLENKGGSPVPTMEQMYLAGNL